MSVERTMSAEGMMALVMVCGFVVFPAGAWAQSATTGSIAGVVRDATGAVLPGVTAEAASPALIEKVRTVVTDGEVNTRSSTCGRAPTR